VDKLEGAFTDGEAKSVPSVRQAKMEEKQSYL
jgi:hypothetical protein